jgi:hypothetical protein
LVWSNVTLGFFVRPRTIKFSTIDWLLCAQTCPSHARTTFQRITHPSGLIFSLHHMRHRGRSPCRLIALYLRTRQFAHASTPYRSLHAFWGLSIATSGIPMIWCRKEDEGQDGHSHCVLSDLHFYAYSPDRCSPWSVSLSDGPVVL